MFDQLGEGVFRRRYQSLDLNVGAVLGSDGVLIVDTRASWKEAAELASELRAITVLPIRWVVNTHWHWDHSFGNARFSKAEIWGHELCKIALERRGSEMRQTAVDWMGPRYEEEIMETEIVPPSHTFAEEISLDIGRPVVLRYHGFGHTDADILVDVPDADVAFMGDLVEQSAPPAFGDSHPIDWPVTLDGAMSVPRTVLVPGHGDVVDPTFARSQQESLSEVARVATRFINGEIDLEHASRLGPYPPETMRTAMVRAQATRA